MSAKVKPRWWCIKGECKHYGKKECKCFHKGVVNLNNGQGVRLRRLRMCPVLTAAEICFNDEK